MDEKKGKASLDAPFPLAVKKPESVPKDSDLFEMHRVSNSEIARKGKQTVVRVFGIPFRVERQETEVVSSLDKVPATQDEIKAFIETMGSRDLPSSLNALIDHPPGISGAISTLINSKNDTRSFFRHKWTLQSVTPVFSQKQSFWKKNGFRGKGDGSYVVILRGEEIPRPGPPPPRGPYNGPPYGLPSRGPGGPPCIVITSNSRNHPVKDKKPAAQIELTQEETEKVINDFLASFTTLYDGISMDEYGAALKAIKLSGEDGDYDSDDSSSSCSSRSLVDD